MAPQAKGIWPERRVDPAGDTAGVAQGVANRRRLLLVDQFARYHLRVARLIAQWRAVAV